MQKFAIFSAALLAATCEASQSQIRLYSRADVARRNEPL